MKTEKQQPDEDAEGLEKAHVDDICLESEAEKEPENGGGANGDQAPRTVSGDAGSEPQ